MLRKVKWFFQGLWARYTRKPQDPEVVKLIVEQARFTLSHESPLIALARLVREARYA